MDLESIDMLTRFLVKASSVGKLDVVQYLIDGGASVNGPEILDLHTDTPLNEASKKGHLEIVRLLITRGASVNKRLETTSPLFLAAKFGHVDIVDFLLENNNTEFNLKDEGINKGYTPLQIAVTGGHYDVIRSLLKHKDVDVNITHPSIGSPLFMLLLIDRYTARWNPPFDVVKLLVEKNADVNFENTGEGHQYPLHIAVVKNRVDIARVLLDNGAKVDAPNYKNTPLQLAHSLPMVCLLLNKGANVNGTGLNSNQTPLHNVFSGDITRVLLNHGAFVNANDADRYYLTPLHKIVTFFAYAMISNERVQIDFCKEIIRLLVDAGADFEALDSTGRTPLKLFQSIYARYAQAAHVQHVQDEVNTLLKEKKGMNMEKRRKRWRWLKMRRCFRVGLAVTVLWNLVKERMYQPGGAGFNAAMKNWKGHFPEKRQRTE